MFGYNICMFDSLVTLFGSDIFIVVLKVLYYASWIFIPLFLFVAAWTLWVHHVRALFFAKQSYLVLEVKLPKDIFKSPKAMEFFINGLWQPGGEGSFMDKYWRGQTRSWFSLEIVSIEGDIHFFIWTKKSFRGAIEANLYSQFPGIELYEVPDYTLSAKFNPEENNIWGTHFALTKPDAYPIKTYMDYGLDKDPEEEYKIDPITPLIEFLGSIGKNHNVWIQIIIRAHAAEDKDPVTGKLVDLRWSKGGEAEIAKILDKAKSKKDEAGKETPGTQLTKTQLETVEALERSISKNGFDTGIRAIYFAPKDVFNGSFTGGVIGGLSHFNSKHLNGFRPAHGLGVKYAWLFDRKGEKLIKQKEELLDAYKKRMYFYAPHRTDHFILNTEELATIFHFPGGVSTTPTFTRIESKKAEAPSNLPI